jgi:hypothetical protein
MIGYGLMRWRLMDRASCTPRFRMAIPISGNVEEGREGKHYPPPT